MWVKLDDNFADHPKIRGLSDAAFRLYVTGLCHCGRHETDGFIDRVSALQMAEAITTQRSLIDGEPESILTLVAAGLWKRTTRRGKSGYRVHDYLQYQWSRRQIREYRESKRRAAQARWREGRDARSSARAMHDAMHVQSNIPDPSLALPDEKGSKNSSHLSTANAQGRANGRRGGDPMSIGQILAEAQRRA